MKALRFRSVLSSTQLHRVIDTARTRDGSAIMLTGDAEKALHVARVLNQVSDLDGNALSSAAIATLEVLVQEVRAGHDPEGRPADVRAAAARAHRANVPRTGPAFDTSRGGSEQ